MRIYEFIDEVDIVWMSPPCTTFSLMTLTYEEYKKKLGDFLPSTKQLNILQLKAEKELKELTQKHTLIGHQMSDLIANIKQIEQLKKVIK